MSIKLLNHRLSSLIVSVQRSVTVRTHFDLGGAMRLLNDEKKFDKALELFDQYKKNNIKTFSNAIITQALKACAHTGDLARGSTIHQFISSRLKDDSYILASLIHMYMQCGDVEHAQSLFDTTTKKELAMYGAMMKGYIKNHQSTKAIDLFNEIEKPDDVILILLFNACAQLRNTEALGLVKKVSGEVPKSSYSNPRLLSSLLDALMKCNDVTYAESLFKTSTTKTLSMYGAMMTGYIKNGQSTKAIELFTEIEKPDEITLIIFFNACAQSGTTEALDLVKKVSKKMSKSFHSNSHLVRSLCDALIKCGDCDSAEILFPKSGKLVSGYGNLMNGYVRENNPNKVLNLFHQMKKDRIEGNHITSTCVIKALSQIGDSPLCQSYVEQIPKTCYIDNQIHNALIDMWGKSGCVRRAKEIFEQVSQPNEITYASMINTYGLNGMGNQAIELYRQVPLELFTEAIHVCVLNACSHSGLVDEARSIFENIPSKTGKMTTSMVDCLSRASFFEEAQKLIDQFECSHSPILPMHMALLSGARNEKNVQLSEQIYDRMKILFPDLTNQLVSAAILLANVYGSAGDMDKASDIRIQLAKSGAKKKIGLSSTVVNEQVYRFRAHDQSHLRSSEIYVELDRISKELAEYGHQYDSSWVTRPLHHDETIASILCGHSERLAIAWNFVANPNTTRIQITKNLRVCGDCHRTTKMIAKIRQCEIIVRDANRIHHFLTNGQCSCNDYF